MEIPRTRLSTNWLLQSLGVSAGGRPEQNNHDRSPVIMFFKNFLGSQCHYFVQASRNLRSKSRDCLHTSIFLHTIGKGTAIKLVVMYRIFFTKENLLPLTQMSDRPECSSETLKRSNSKASSRKRRR